ncbi:MAG: hypothetical protein AAFV25_18035 [Bacteroidota bacterium]
MKKILSFATVLLGLTLVIVSCQKEDLQTQASFPESNSVPSGLELDQNNASLVLPDLTIVAYRTTVTATTTACGIVPIDTGVVTPVGQLREFTKRSPDAMPADITPVEQECPNVSCAGGQRFFRAFVGVKNIGRAPLPPGELSVEWFDSTPAGTFSLVQTIPHNGIPVDGLLRFSRPYYMGPCDCAPPPFFFKHIFWAVVDPANLIQELSELNNRSENWAACDGC